MSKTITRLYDDYADAAAAVKDLEMLGVAHEDVSIVANNANGVHSSDDHGGINDHGDVSRGTLTGAMLGGAGGLLAGLGLLAIPGLGPIVAAGWLAATAVGAGVGAAGGAATGSLVGALKNAGHTDSEANVYSEGVRRGGTLVSAKVADNAAQQAEAAMDRHRPVDASARETAYRKDGWTGFDTAAPAYTMEQVDRERAGYTRIPSDGY